MKYTVDNRGIVKLIGEQENLYMAKENKGFGFNGALEFVNGKYLITETVKGVESTYDLSAKLDEFVGNNVSISGKLETAIEPIED